MSEPGQRLYEALQVMTPERFPSEPESVKRRYATAEAALLRPYVEALTEGERRLTQALGVIVEFGNLNGFRNLSDQELGATVTHMAVACSDTVDSLRALLSTTEGNPHD